MYVYAPGVILICMQSKIDRHLAIYFPLFDIMYHKSHAIPSFIETIQCNVKENKLNYVVIAVHHGNIDEIDRCRINQSTLLFKYKFKYNSRSGRLKKQTHVSSKLN